MTSPSSPSEDQDQALEKELSLILDEVEAIINDPSESIERKKEAQTMIQRAIEKGSSNSDNSSESKIGEEFRKRYVYITKMYYDRQIEELDVIKATLKRQIEDEEKSPKSPQRLKELERDLEECERTIESHKHFLRKVEQ